jgi:FkbM family methyltransferase
MKNLTVIKDNKWIWPANDENSWNGQNECQDLPLHVLPYVKNKNVMIQAGGNCGFMLSKFVDHFKTIYTFEPDPVNFYCLNQNVTQDNVIKMQCCLGSDNNPVKVQQLVRPGRLHDIGGVHIAGYGYTPSITIDGLNLPECDLIQLDIEGFELNALLGGLETIKKYKPVLCIEFCEKWLNRYDSSSEKIEKLLEELGYQHRTSHGVDRIYAYKNI